jgi:hypothetical protein
MREGGILEGAAVVAALLLIGLGVAAATIRVYHASGLGRIGGTGLLVRSIGAALLLTSSIVQAIVFGGDFVYMPLLVIPGGLALIVGMLLLGIAVLRAAPLPRWVGALLIIGTLAMIGYNDQNARALMAIPFGIAWLAVGYMLWVGRRTSPANIVSTSGCQEEGS